MIRSCQEDSWRISQKSSLLHVLLTFVHIISFQQYHFTQQTLTLSRTKRSGLESPPTRAEVSPNKGLLSRPLVPYVLVVKSSMAGCSRRVPASRLLGSQQLLLLETPGPGRMLASFWRSLNSPTATLWWSFLPAGGFRFCACGWEKRI